MTRPILRRVQRRPTALASRVLRPTIADLRAEQRAEALAKRDLLTLQLQLANGDTCIRQAAEARGLTPAELKAQLYGRPAA